MPLEAQGFQIANSTPISELPIKQTQAVILPTYTTSGTSPLLALEQRGSCSSHRGHWLRSIELLCCNWMPDDPTPFVQDKAVVAEVRAGEERPQVIDLILLGLD